MLCIPTTTILEVALLQEEHSCLPILQMPVCA